MITGRRPMHDDADPREDTGQYRRLASESVDELDQRVALSDRERELARNVAELVARGMTAIRDRPANLRLAQAETELAELRAWRLRLTGVADSNGRIGVLERSIDEHREDTSRALELIRLDVGPSDERKAEREAAKLVGSFVAGVKSRMRASLLVSLVAVGGSAWGWLSARSDARATAAAATARTDTRLDFLERVVLPRAGFPLPDARTP